MIKIDDNTSVDLDVLAESHYDNLIGSLLAGGENYHSRSSLIQRIKNRRKIDAAIPNQQRVDFWDYLLLNKFINLKRIIISRPDILKNIISEIELICGVGFFSTDINYNEAELTDFGKIVKKIFNYSSYRGKPECKDNCAKFNLSLCPYCNEQTLHAISEINLLTGEHKRLALLQLDHFYPQSRHPYFAVSFFNLVPGCSPCNAHLKLEKKFDIDTHFNPFHDRFDDYFIFKLRNIILLNETDVAFDFSNKLAHDTNAIVDFEIMTRYSNDLHKRAILSLVNSFKNHSKKINKSLSFQLSRLFIGNESQRKTLLANHNVPLQTKEINKVHLGKLKRDIANQLGMYDDI